MDFGRLQVNMSFEEAKRVKALLMRDESMPVVDRFFTDNEGKEWHRDYCPACDSPLGINDDEFCGKCGQRVDRSTKAL